MDGPKGKYAWTATVGEKGQIVIPKQARDKIYPIKWTQQEEGFLENGHKKKG